MLKGLPVSSVGTLIREHITLMPGGRTLDRHDARARRPHRPDLRRFTLFTGPVAERIGFDEHRGNVLDLDGAAFAGTVTEPILGRDAKRSALIESARQAAASHRGRPSPSATARTISQCWRKPGSASRSGQNPRSRLRPEHGSSTAT